MRRAFEWVATERGIPRLKLAIAMFAGFCLMNPTVARAAPIFGTLDIAGAVRVTETMIDWVDPVGGGFGDAEVQPTSTGTFAGLGGTVDRVQDLEVGDFPTGPAGTFDPLPFFQMLLAAPEINFVLEAIAPCSDLGAFVDCAFGPDSPFGLAEVAGNTTVSMVMTGIVFDVTTPHLVSDWTGIWTAQFPEQTIEQLVAEFLAVGQIDTSYSASKITVERPVSEPAMLLMFGLGTALVARRLRRGRKE